MFFTIFSGGPIRASTTLYYGLVLVERRFDGRFQSRSAKWLEYVPKGAGGHGTLHCSVIRVSGEKDDRQMEVAADGDCGNDAIDGSSKGDVHKNQIWLM
jgi:hypothetical protein